MNRFFLIIGSFVLAFLFSCGKQKVKIEYINSALIKEALTIKDGSYFIYKDSIGGIIDSFWVDDFQGSIYGRDYYEKTEYLSYYMFHKDGVKRFNFSADGTYKFQGLKYFRFNFRLDSSNWFGNIALTDPQNSIENFNTIYIETLESFSLHNIIYTDVFVYMKQDSAYFSKSYYSKTNGLIKLAAKNSDTQIVYELIKSKIIK